MGNRPRPVLPEGHQVAESKVGSGVASTERWDLEDRAPGLEVDVRERRSRMCQGHPFEEMPPPHRFSPGHLS